MKTNFIIPNWNAPKHIKSIITHRQYQAGTSQVPFDSFNLAVHVDDDLQSVYQNRQILKDHLNLKQDPIWLTQIHSQTAVELTPDSHLQIDQIQADASFTNLKNIPSVVLTADCLPLLVTDIHGKAVASIHAGWRGLLQGIIEETIFQMQQRYNMNPNEFLVHLGPAISQKHFEVGQEVYDFFTVKNQLFAQGFIRGHIHGKYFADIYQLARLHLTCLGIPMNQISGGEYCTVEDNDLFYSYRKQNKTGRMASLIWIEKD